MSEMMNKRKPWNTARAALAWGITDSRVRALCRQGRVKGAYLRSVQTERGRIEEWQIPVNAQKPIMLKQVKTVMTSEDIPFNCTKCSRYKMMGCSCKSKVLVTKIDNPTESYYRCARLGRRIIPA